MTISNQLRKKEKELKELKRLKLLEEKGEIEGKVERKYDIKVIKKRFNSIKKLIKSKGIVSLKELNVKSSKYKSRVYNNLEKRLNKRLNEINERIKLVNVVEEEKKREEIEELNRGIEKGTKVKSEEIFKRTKKKKSKKLQPNNKR